MRGRRGGKREKVGEGDILKGEEGLMQEDERGGLGREEWASVGRILG